MNFKAIALTTTALVALASTVGPAQAGKYMGKVNLGLGAAFEDWAADGGEDSSDISEDLEYTTIHGSAQVNVPITSRMNGQFGIFGAESMDEGYDCCGGENSNYGSFYGGFGLDMHLYYSDDVGAFGVWGAVSRTNAGWDWDEHVPVFAAGFDGQYFLREWTLVAQAGLIDSDDTYGVVQDAGFIRLGANFYPTPRLKLAGRVGYMDGATSGGDSQSDVTEYNWQFSIEYGMGRSVPVTVYLEYLGLDLEVDTGSSSQGEHDRHELRAGVRFLFGGDHNGSADLQEMDKEGPGMDTPDIITWPRFGTLQN